MKMLEQLRAAIQAALEARAAYQNELDAVIEGAEARGDGNLNEDETAKFADLRAKLQTADEDIDGMKARLADLEDAEARRKAAADFAADKGLKPGEMVVRREARTYSPDTTKQGGSFLRDVIARYIDNDFDAAQRLNRHMQEELVERRAVLARDMPEARATNTGAFAGLTVPQYLTDMVAPLARAMRPFVDITNHHDLPASGMTVNISRITTGSSTAAQTAENAAASETDIDDTLLTVPVNTIAGQQTISRQAVDRSVGADAITIQDLYRSFWTTTDNQLLNGSGSSGQHQGLDGTSGIVSVSYTSGSPTVVAAWPNIFNLIQQIQAGVFMGVQALVMAPRRFWWFANAVGTSFPFFSIAPNPAAQGQVDVSTGGRVAEFGYGMGPSGYIAGLPVYVDGNVTLTKSSNQDAIYGVTRDELHFWSDPSAPLLIRAEQTKAANLGVLLVVYGYQAFTAARYAGAHGAITGTGLAAPSFTGS